MAPLINHNEETANWNDIILKSAVIQFGVFPNPILYGNMGCRFFKGRDTKLLFFWPKINQENYRIF